MAEIVLRLVVEAESGATIQVNSVLVAARSDAEAYEKSLGFGRLSEAEYSNTDGHHVSVTFLGLRELLYIYDGLADGSELAYEELLDLSEEEAATVPKPKNRLAVFAAAEGGQSGSQINDTTGLGRGGS